jgi:hypothetical protein
MWARLAPKRPKSVLRSRSLHLTSGTLIFLPPIGSRRPLIKQFVAAKVVIQVGPDKRLLECGSRVVLRRVGKRTLGEPGVEDSQLVVGWIEERDAHANSFVGVNDVCFGCEGPVIAGDDHVEVGTCREWVQIIHVASLAADFVDSSHYARLSRGHDDFRHGDEGIPGHRPLSAVC